MDSETNDALARAHDRIDDLVKCTTRTATLLESVTENVKEISESVKTSLHKSPCHELCSVMKAVESLQNQNAKTVELEREVKRDWRKWFLGLLKVAIIGIAAFIAGRASEFWHFLKGH